MGKLHTLRRAIEREPEKWLDSQPPEFLDFPTGRVYPTQIRPVYGAIFDNGQWRPIESIKDYGIFGGSYRKFIKSVLVEIGYKNAVG